MKFITVVFILLSYSSLRAQTLEFKKVETNVNSSFRGLSVVNDSVAWVSGSNGWVGVSTDGGGTWIFNQVKGFEESGFRSLYAFDDQRAVIANAGAPANILITNDGGKTWKVVYTNKHKDAFFDGVDFWNDKEGIIYGDPIDSKMLLLKTNDGGNTWTEIKDRPELGKGEASFAASGTGIRCVGKKKVVISTGGTVSRLWVSEDKGKNWNFISPPIVQGENTTGIYSFAIQGATMILVGGDYTKADLATKHNLYSTDNGKTWQTPSTPARGYRECVEFLSAKTLITTGPTGTDISYDGGKSWKKLSEEKGFHVLRKARKGSLTIIAGGDGKISIVE